MAEEPAERLPVGVKGLSAVSLFNDFASEMVYPLLPAFVTGPLGGSAVALGALDGAADLTSALLRYVSGRLADRPGWAKPLVLIGYGTAVLIRPVIAAATAAWQVVGFRVIDRIGKGLRSPARDAMIVSLAPPPIRGRAFGFHRGADHLGAVLGSLAAWFFLQNGTDVRRVIELSAFPGVLAVALLWFVLRRISLPPERRDAGATGLMDDSPPAPASLPKAFWLPIAALVLLTAARLPETLVLLRLQQLGVPVAAIPLAWAALHIVRSAASYPGGWLADRLGARGALAVGTLLYALAMAGLSLMIGSGLALGIFLMHGVVAGLTEPAERVVVSRLSPRGVGRGFGTYQGLAGVAALPAGLLFGAAYVRAGGPAALIGSSVAAGAGMLAWLAVSRTGAAAGR